MIVRHALVLSVLATGLVAFAADPAPAPTTAPAATAPAAAPTTEAPAQLEPVEITAEKRMENAFRTVQLGLKRKRSQKAEDAELIVCEKTRPVGSSFPVISCATNRHWDYLRSTSLQGGVGDVSGAAAAGSSARRKEDQVFTMTVSQFNELQKRFGKLPKDDAGKE